jgi:arsenite methyltransferase
MRDEEIKKAVRERYAEAAQKNESCCSPAPSCCGPKDTPQQISTRIGYSDQDLKSVPEGSNLGLGCGNPLALASLKPGEVVLDLGAGAGFDCFLAANAVGRDGMVIGVDMTPEMVAKARENARKGNYSNVEFRLGEIENLPAADHSVDIVISNCVINLAPNKKRVFQEAFRVLKPTGRLMVSDIVWLKELPQEIKNSVSAYVSCIAGAISKEAYLEAIRQAGFAEAKILEETLFPVELTANDPMAKAVVQSLNLTPEKVRELAGSIASIKVSGRKPHPSLEGSPREFRDRTHKKRVNLELASPEDEPQIKDLLAQSGLPHQDITSAHLRSFWVLRTEGGIVGVIGLQVLGKFSLLRSLTVTPPYRRQGWATQLINKVEEYAVSRNVDTLYLLAPTEEEFFSRRGYRKIARHSAPKALQDLPEFQTLCSADAACLVKQLRD